MDPILGIDLGTTNSVVSIIENGQPVVLRDAQGLAILPSVVGFDSSGRLLVGQEARNQALLAPERTIKSVKRHMGEEAKIRLADNEYSPQEISAMILRTLKQRAETSLGREARKAVITVPAFFNENQREATREAGELAGLEVVRIINEPTAASLTYEPISNRRELLLVYDLGGGTFDVSIVQVEKQVVEVLASHGDTHLGGDDFDQLLLDYVADRFQEEHGLDLRQIPTAKSRLLQAVEQAKIRLSNEAYTTVAEEFIAEKDGVPLNLQVELNRPDYEELIAPLLHQTLTSVDTALEDAKLAAGQIDRIVLVGGSTRTPLVRLLLEGQLGQDPHQEVDPDMCVSMGAAVQGGLIAGVDVGPVLVDITPYTLGLECLGELHGRMTDKAFSPVIPRNTPLPATRSEVYYTNHQGQEIALIHVLQGENRDARFNDSVGEFELDGLDQQANRGNEILVRFELNLDGILAVTAVERKTGLQKQITIDNAITRFRANNREEARARLAAAFGESVSGDATQVAEAETRQQMYVEVLEKMEKANRLLPGASAEDAEELQQLVSDLEQAIAAHQTDRIEQLHLQLDDLVFYLEDA